MRDEDGDAEHNAYGFAEFDFSPKTMPVSLTARLGYERGAFDWRDAGGKWDWAIGATARNQYFRFGLDYVGSNVGDGTIVASVFLAY